MKRTWTVRGDGVTVFDRSVLRDTLLRQRGLEQENAERYFEPVYDRDVYDPLTLLGMEAAVERIYAARRDRERIMVYGDYDADGVSSTAILVTVLEELGLSVVPFLPHRGEHGYGLNQGVLEDIIGDIDLVITCDCGISNAEEIAWLAEQGIDTIVVDHHTVPAQLPAAVAIVHPDHPEKKYAGGALCGAGVSWKVASALLRDPRSPFHTDSDKEKWLLDLAALGTVADMVPLTGENRTIVQFGLEILRRTRRPGLEAFLSVLRLDRAHLSAQDISFRLAPRLNAAGRMDHPQPALDLLLTRDAGHAQELVAQLEVFNRQRQTVTARMLKEIETQVGDDPVIFAYNESWPAGVVGLAAGRLADRYCRPAVVVGSNGRHAVGSARSPEGMNILHILQQGRDVLLALGGHAQAAGFSLLPNQIEEFRRRIMVGVEVSTDEAVAEAADVVLDQSLLDTATLAMIDDFAPFGEGNSRPNLVIQNMSLVGSRTVGKTADHAKFTWEVNGDRLDGIGFGLAEQLTAFKGKAMDVLGTLEANEWQGRRSLQIAVQEVAVAGTVEIVASS